MSQEVCFGIYLGNSTCCIAVNKDGKVEVVANAAGDRVTAAVVAFHQAEVVIGGAAKQGLLRYGGSTIEGVLKAIEGGDKDIVSLSHPQCQSPSGGRESPVYSIQQGDKTVQVSSDEVLKHILKLLKDIATSHTNNGELPVIVSLPAWACEATIQRVKCLAESVNFHVLSTISQPSAACLAYGLLDSNTEYLTVVVLHCGGSTVMGSVVDVAGGLLSIRESTAPSSVAGNTLTEVLAKHFAKEFFAKYKGDPLESKRSRQKLYCAAENCKHVLSTMSTGQVHVESLWEGIDFSTQLSRARFEGLVTPTLCEFLQPIKNMVQKCGLHQNDINKVVLTGGSCKIPKLQQLVSETFPEAEVLFRLPPDEALAFGAACEAALHLRHSDESRTLSSHVVPALANSVYCKVSCSDVSECIFSKGTPTYTRRSINIPVDVLHSQSISLLIYEASEPSSAPAEGQVLAEVNSLHLVSEVRMLQLHCLLKSDGSLHVTLHEPASKVSQSFIIEGGRS